MPSLPRNSAPPSGRAIGTGLPPGGPEPLARRSGRPTCEPTSRPGAGLPRHAFSLPPFAWQRFAPPCQAASRPPPAARVRSGRPSWIAWSPPPPARPRSRPLCPGAWPSRPAARPSFAALLQAEWPARSAARRSPDFLHDGAWFIRPSASPSADLLHRPVRIPAPARATPPRTPRCERSRSAPPRPHPRLPNPRLPSLRSPLKRSGASRRRSCEPSPGAWPSPRPCRSRPGAARPALVESRPARTGSLPPAASLRQGCALHLRPCAGASAAPPPGFAPSPMARDRSLARRPQRGPLQSPAISEQSPAPAPSSPVARRCSTKTRAARPIRFGRTAPDRSRLGSLRRRPSRPTRAPPPAPRPLVRTIPPPSVPAPHGAKPDLRTPIVLHSSLSPSAARPRPALTHDPALPRHHLPRPPQTPRRPDPVRRPPHRAPHARGAVPGRLRPAPRLLPPHPGPGRRPRRPGPRHRRGRAEADALVAAWRAAPPALWFTYHCYWKAPDLLGPRVARALNIPYVISEPSLSPRRRAGPWALYAAEAEAAIRAADLLLWSTPRDLPMLEAAGDLPLAPLPPFVDAGPPPRPSPRPAPCASSPPP
jgi:hypothetical protein